VYSEHCENVIWQSVVEHIVRKVLKKLALSVVNVCQS